MRMWHSLPVAVVLLYILTSDGRVLRVVRQ